MSLAIDAVASECVAMAASLGSSSGPCLHGCELILAAVKDVKVGGSFVLATRTN